MLRKQTANKSSFTIIEVVITIAIGAAVMALVLNAVAATCNPVSTPNTQAGCTTAGGS